MSVGPRISEHLDHRGMLTPECRSFLMATTLGAVGRLIGPVRATTVFAEVLAYLKLPEEAAGAHIWSAMLLACQSGLLISNTYDPTKRSMTFGADTTIAASRSLTAFVWDDDYYRGDEGEGA